MREKPNSHDGTEFLQKANKLKYLWVLFAKLEQREKKMDLFFSELQALAQLGLMYSET